MLNLKTILTSVVIWAFCSFTFAQAPLDRVTKMPPKAQQDYVDYSPTVTPIKKDKQANPNNTVYARRLIQIAPNQFIEIVTIEGKDYILGIRRHGN